MNYPEIGSLWRYRDNSTNQVYEVVDYDPNSMSLFIRLVGSDNLGFYTYVGNWYECCYRVDINRFSDIMDDL